MILRLARTKKWDCQSKTATCTEYERHDYVPAATMSTFARVNIFLLPSYFLSHSCSLLPYGAVHYILQYADQWHGTLRSMGLLLITVTVHLTGFDAVHCSCVDGNRPAFSSSRNHQNFVFEGIIALEICAFLTKRIAGDVLSRCWKFSVGGNRFGRILQVIRCG